jgi:hypothetical protein
VAKSDEIPKVPRPPRPIDGRGLRVSGGTQLGPEEANLPEEVLAIWGISDMTEFARRLHTPAIRDALERMPPEIGAPLRALGERIREEKQLVG